MQDYKELPIGVTGYIFRELRNKVINLFDEYVLDVYLKGDYESLGDADKADEEILI